MKTTDPFKTPAKLGDSSLDAPLDPFGLEPDADPFAEAEADAPLFREESKTRWLPHPETGKVLPFARASSWASTIEEQFNLTRWRVNMAVMGATNVPSLTEMGIALGMDDWHDYDDVVELALAAAKSYDGAVRGTARHLVKERISAGNLSLEDMPEGEMRDDMAEYLHQRAKLGLEDTKWVETLVVLPGLDPDPGRRGGVCGRLDNVTHVHTLCKANNPWFVGPGHPAPEDVEPCQMVTDQAGTYYPCMVIDDLKTGQHVDMGLDGIAVQLGIYANAEWYLNPVTGVYSPPVAVNPHVAMVSWLPSGGVALDPAKPQEKTPRLTVIPVDIAKGWAMAQAIGHIREYLRAAKRVPASRKGSGSLQLPMGALGL